MPTNQSPYARFIHATELIYYPKLSSTELEYMQSEVMHRGFPATQLDIMIAD